MKSDKKILKQLKLLPHADSKISLHCTTSPAVSTMPLSQILFMRIFSLLQPNTCVDSQLNTRAMQQLLSHFSSSQVYAHCFYSLPCSYLSSMHANSLHFAYHASTLVTIQARMCLVTSLNGKYNSQVSQTMIILLYLFKNWVRKCMFTRPTKVCLNIQCNE